MRIKDTQLLAKTACSGKIYFFCKQQKGEKRGFFKKCQIFNSNPKKTFSENFFFQPKKWKFWRKIFFWKKKKKFNFFDKGQKFPFFWLKKKIFLKMFFLDCCWRFETFCKNLVFDLFASYRKNNFFPNMRSSLKVAYP